MELKEALQEKAKWVCVAGEGVGEMVVILLREVSPNLSLTLP